MAEHKNNQTAWGPDNPHPLSRMKTELVWEGKYDEYGNRRPIKLPTSSLPLQRIETIDEPRDHEKAIQGDLFNRDSFNKKAHRDDFRNMLIWGDNKLAMVALLEQFRGKIDLIYIDPPFDVGADFTMQVQIGDEGEAVQKEQSILEAVAYKDTWGKGTDSYLHMMYERLVLMHDLLNEKGSIFIHLDYRMGSIVRCLMDEIFGQDNFINEIIWQKCNSKNFTSNSLSNIHDTIFFYVKSHSYKFFEVFEELKDEYVETAYRYKDESGRRYRLLPLHAPGRSGGPTGQHWRGIKPLDGNHWRFMPETLDRMYEQELIEIGSSGIPQYKKYLDDSEGRRIGTIWLDAKQLPISEKVNYPTQKPSSIIDKVIRLGSEDGDLVADFFCGSGTTLAVAEKLGRRWIGVDLGRYSIHTTRKRLIQVQRELHADDKPYRSFDVYNLGRYERQWWQMERLKGADDEHRRIVLQFYKALPLTNPPSPLLHGKKGGAYVYVDQIDSLLTYEELVEVCQATQSAGGRELHCLAWEFEMELAHKKQAIEAETGLDVRLKYIPREIMEPNRVECQFFEAGYLQVKPIREDGKIDVELTRFTPALAEAPESEISALRERAIKSPFDFIDFWSIDFEWHDSKPFEHHWQDFRTRKDRTLKTKSNIGWKYETKGRKHICVKVIDVFGVDTTTVIEVEV